jgi:O-antigen ligase
MLLVALAILASYFMMSLNPNGFVNRGNEIIERIKLANVSAIIFSDNYLFGIGLGNFINSLFDLYPKYTSWLLQPVHNIFLLILTETGLYGLIFSFVLFTKIIYKSLQNKYLLIGVLIIMISGMFDHYHLTLQQNLLINTFLFGVIYSKNI